MPNALQFNNTDAIVQPTPLYAVTMTPLQNKMGKFGASYQLTISGQILYVAGARKERSTKVIGNVTDAGTVKSNGLEHIQHVQQQIMQMLDMQQDATHGLTVSINDANGDNDVLTFARCKVDSVNFEDGIHVNLARYTITLTAEALYKGDTNGALHQSSMMDLHEYGANYANDTNLSYMLEDFTESWEVQPDDSYGTSSSNGLVQTPRSYTVSRTVTAVGKSPRHRSTNETHNPAWVNASNFLTKYIYTNDSTGHQTNGLGTVLGQSLLNVPAVNQGGGSTYSAFNHSRTEQVDKAAGSVTVTDNWVLANTNDYALETFEASASTDSSNPFVKVSINGTLKGLGSWNADKEYVDDTGAYAFSPIGRAQYKYNLLSNHGNFGAICALYKRANAVTNANLNTQPLSVTVGRNEISGEITYSMEFDNRPSNYFSHVVSENVQISDTYPGDQFAVIPVIGRAIGPILQFTFGRTEYKRSVSIDVQLDYTDIDYTRTRASYITSRPSCLAGLRDEVNGLLSSISPASEPGIRKYFLSPPQETWSPKEGRYSLQLEWTYEMSD